MYLYLHSQDMYMYTAYVIIWCLIMFYEQHFAPLRTSRHIRRAALRTDTSYMQEQHMVRLTGNV